MVSIGHEATTHNNVRPRVTYELPGAAEHHGIYTADLLGYLDQQ
jgi:hypothetical protein